MSGTQTQAESDGDWFREFGDALQKNPHLVEVLLLGDEDFESNLCSYAEDGDVESMKTALGNWENYVTVENFDRALGKALKPAITANQTDATLLLLNNGGNLMHEEFDAELVLLALRNRNAILVQTLLDCGVCGRTTSIVQEAVRWGSHAILRDLILKENCLDHCLYEAVRLGSVEVVRLLLAMGANAEGSSDRTSSYSENEDEHEDEDELGEVEQGLPLATAASQNSGPLVLELLKNGADPANSKALCSATEHAIDDAAHVLHYLLHQFALRYSNGKAGFGEEALELAVANERHDLVQAMLKAKVGVPGLRLRAEGLGSHPLASAILKDGDTALKLVEVFLRAGVEVDRIVVVRYDAIVSISRSETPLLLAIRTKQCPMIKLLLKWGASVNLAALSGIKRTPLQQAVEIGSIEVVKTLLDEGADIRGAPHRYDGSTALQLAASGGLLEIAALLVNSGAFAFLDEPEAEYVRVSALLEAIANGHLEMTMYLIGSFPYITSEIQGALRLAKRKSHDAIVRLLQDIVSNAPANEHYERGLQIASGSINRDQQHDTIEAMDADPPSTPLSSSRYRCHECDVELYNAYALKRHKKTLHAAPDLQKKYVCSLCGREFVRKDMLDRHSATHDRHGYPTCSKCKRKFRRDYLKLHQQRCNRATEEATQSI